MDLFDVCDFLAGVLGHRDFFVQLRLEYLLLEIFDFDEVWVIFVELEVVDHVGARPFAFAGLIIRLYKLIIVPALLADVE